MDFCSKHNIILQPVVTYNHTMQCRIWKCYWLLITTQPCRTCVRQRGYPFVARRHSQIYVQNNLWAKRDGHDELSTANDRMQPAFVGSYKNVAIGPTFWL